MSAKGAYLKAAAFEYHQPASAEAAVEMLAELGEDASGASTVTLTVNGERRRARVEPRRTLADLLRQELGLTGTHLACEHGVCGSCTVLVDGEAVRSCLMFGVQADGSEVTTVEGLAGDEPGALGPVQRAFWETHGLQCGFCTPGFVVSVTAFLRDCPDPDDEQIRAALSGNLCRCTGYQGIVRAVRLAARFLRGEQEAGS